MWAVDTDRVGNSKQEWVCPAGSGTSDVVIGWYKPSPRPTGGNSPAHVAMTTRDEGGMMTGLGAANDVMSRHMEHACEEWDKNTKVLGSGPYFDTRRCLGLSDILFILG